MDKSEIQVLIDRLAALKKRHAKLSADQLALTLLIAESAAQNEQAREYLVIEHDRLKRDEEHRKQSRRSGG